MMGNIPEVVAAISTPLGMGGIGVVRISGRGAQKIADRVFRGAEKLQDKKGYEALFGGIYDQDGVKIDECVALNFLAPKSFTGENTVELSCHGGIFVMKRVLSAVLSAGASPAGPGEFTKRAFMNGKMDLTQAEAVMDLISAEGERARQSALAGKDGALS
ncbi:MAG: tRNA uridine-5-carboxymethylaminomethyl(34) synthesis GTPase MnmE, partial [Oscillospiraceae bacterium]